jgi:RNA polymerase sigma factor (sigma-70 family)
VARKNQKIKKSVEKPIEPTPRESFEDLIRRISEGSETAVFDLLDRYSKNIMRVVRRRLPREIRTKVDSVDIVQSVWKSLLDKGVPLDRLATPEDFVAYLAGAARLKIFEAHRHYTCAASNIRREVQLPPQTAHQVGQPSSQEPDAGIDQKGNTPSAVVGARETWERAIDKAGALGRRAIQLKLQGLTLDEMAEQMGLSKRSVQRLLDSILQSLTT